KYVHGPGIDETLAVKNDSGVFSYYHADALGSIVKTTNDAGAVMATRQYDAWGNLESGADLPGYAFAGREWDPESGLYYHRASYYDAKAGRFLSEDPIGFAAGMNLYTYVTNNPVNLTDPFGLRPLTACEKQKLRPYIPTVDLDNADIHDGKVPWWFRNKNYDAVT